VIPERKASYSNPAESLASGDRPTLSLASKHWKDDATRFLQGRNST
jgi:hypothetical protein